MVRRELKRSTLTRNIKRAIARAQSENLPATIKEVYAFGGILRDKNKAHDFDAVFSFDQTLEQKAKWTRFCCCFGQVCTQDEKTLLQELGVDPKELREQIYAILHQYYSQSQRVSLREMATLDSVIAQLKSMGIEPSWVRCFSWTEVFFNRFGLFRPNIEKVLRSILCRGMKGMQIHFEKYDPSKNGLTWPAKNYQIAWTPEKPDIEKNLEMRPEEKIIFLTNELKHFIEQLAQLKKNFSEIRDELSLLAQSLGIALNLKELTLKHIEVSHRENESYVELKVKCEQARQEMRAYNNETLVLRCLLSSMKNFQERLNDPFFSKHTPQDWITYWTILRAPRSYVKEKRIREILKDLGLPEHHIVAIRHVGYTDHKLEPDKLKRKELHKQAETAEKERKLTFKVRKIVKKIQRNVRAYVRLDEKNKVAHIGIHGEPVEDDRTNELFVKEWRKRGFKTTQSEWTLSAVKNLEFRGNETLSGIEQLLMKALGTYQET
jgi:hypothetical protein